MAKIQTAELVAKFTGDTTELDKSIISATVAVTKYTTAVGIAAVGALTALTKRQMDMIDTNLDLADQLGITTESLSAMKQAFDESGTSAEQVSGALGIMQRNLFSAASGTGAQADAIAALGLNINDLLSMAPDEQFAQIASAIAGIENPTAKAGLATQIFGRNAKDLMLVFDDYAAKVQEVTEFQDRFNISVSNVDSEKIGEANDAMARVGKIAEGVGNTIAVQVSPLITEMANNFVEASYDGEDFGNAVKSGMEVAGVAIDVIRHAVLGFRLTFNGVIQGMLEGVARAKEALGMEGGTARALANESAAQVRAITDEMKNFESTADKIAKIQASAQERATRAVATKQGGSASTGGIDWEALTGGSEKSTKALKDTDDALADVKKRMIELNNATGDTVGGLVSSLLKGENAWESFRNKAFDVIEDVINNMFRLSFGGTADNGVGGFLADAIFSGLGLASGGSSIGNPNIPGTSYMFADGGVVSGANMFPIGGNTGVMGEAGPEAIMPLTRGPGGKLSVQAVGGGGPKVEQHINISTGVQQTVRVELQRMLPQIAQASVGAIQNARNRNILKEM